MHREFSHRAPWTSSQAMPGGNPSGKGWTQRGTSVPSSATTPQTWPRAAQVGSAWKAQGVRSQVGTKPYEHCGLNTIQKSSTRLAVPWPGQPSPPHSTSRFMALSIVPLQ